jgi:flagellar hook-associated protein 3 FlgL
LSAAINAQTSATGVAASVDANGALQLTENFNGEIKMSHVEINGVDFAEQEVEYFANFTSYDGSGQVVGEIRKLTDMDQIVSTSVNNLNSTINHISSQMAFVGAQINKVDTQTQVLSERKITVDEKISEIGDADLTELVTQLKSLILNRDAAQQAFVKIGQQSLFDFLR